MNSFDLVVYLGLVVAVVIGFKAGLLRSAVTILGYLVAMPIAVWTTSLIGAQIGSTAGSPVAEKSLVFFGIFLVSGMVLGTLLRTALNDTIGPDIGPGDRIAGAALGAARVVLIAVTMVLIFDRLIPNNLQPTFLAGSQLRPLLSIAGQKGLGSLAPDVIAYVDRMKRNFGI